MGNPGLRVLRQNGTEENYPLFKALCRDVTLDLRKAGYRAEDITREEVETNERCTTLWSYHNTPISELTARKGKPNLEMRARWDVEPWILRNNSMIKTSLTVYAALVEKEKAEAKRVYETIQRILNVRGELIYSPKGDESPAS